MSEHDLDVAIEMCERIMEFDTRTMQNPVSENGYIFEKVYELLQYLRQFQFATDTNIGGNLIDRQAAIKTVRKAKSKGEAHRMLVQLPSVQSNLSEAYSNAVFTWLMDYQIRAAELKGRYTPYEVLSWVINDWRKENE